MSEHNPLPDEKFKRLGLVNPLKHADLLNAMAKEVAPEAILLPETQHIINELLRIAAGKDKKGGAQMVGLAAPQIGVKKRIIIVDMAATGQRETQQMQVFINPTITEHGNDLVDGREGCWSCDNYCANVPRAEWVVVEGFNCDGKPIHKKAAGFTARILQHEIDHLDGIRCIDRVPIGEPERLHYVNKNSKKEFDRYRKGWATWPHHFLRETWEKFREGEKL